MFPEVKSTSPDGRLQLRVKVWEARNSLWIESPAVYRLETEEVLLKFHSEMWSLDQAEWTGRQTVDLMLRKYPGNHTPRQLTATVDFGRNTAALHSLPTVTTLQELEPLLESQLKWT